MQTIGERLLDARQRRGVSIREAAEATKVRGDYLAAMEANQFESIPLADVYRRGFLKIYARFLRLDSDRIVGDFNALLAARNPVVLRGRRGEFLDPVRSIEPREPEGMDEFSTGAIEAAVRPDARRQMLMIGGGVVSLLVLAGVLVTSCSSSTDKPKSATADVSADTGEVIFIAKGRSASVSVYRAPTVKGGPEGAEVFREIIPANGFVTMRKDGDFVVRCAEPIDFKINGGLARTFAPGYNAVTIQVPRKGR